MALLAQDPATEEEVACLRPARPPASPSILEPAPRSTMPRRSTYAIAMITPESAHHDGFTAPTRCGGGTT